MNRIGIVAIGRNEGERLKRCLQAVVGGAATVVYVDSNSTDDSVAVARDAGATVVELDMSSSTTVAPMSRAIAALPSVEPEST